MGTRMPDPDTTRLPQSWKPQQGEVLAGFVQERHERPSNYSDEPVVVLVVDYVEGQASLWCSTKQLRSMVADNDPQPGDFLKVCFLGEEWVRYTNSYRKLYTCQVEKA